MLGGRRPLPPKRGHVGIYKKEKQSMKHRIGALLFALALMLSLAACGGEPSEEKEPSDPKTSQAEEGDNGAADEQSEPEVPTANGVGDLGNFHAEIKGAVLTKDHEGKPVIVVTYAWTNNSEDTTSAMISMYEKAFQDGVQLERAYLFNNPDYESNSDKDVRPGTTIDIQSAFTLTSETSPVEFELTEAFSFSDEKLTMDFDPAGLS